MAFLIRGVPRSARDRVDVAGQRGFESLVGFIRATVLVAVLDAVGIGIGLVAVGVPLVLPLAALTFLAACIPVIGAVVSGVVAVLVVLVTNGTVPVLIVLGVVIGVQQLEGNVLQPLLLGRAVKLNGVAVVLAVAVGSVVAGIRVLVSENVKPDDRLSYSVVRNAAGDGVRAPDPRSRRPRSPPTRTPDPLTAESIDRPTDEPSVPPQLDRRHTRMAGELPGAAAPRRQTVGCAACTGAGICSAHDPPQESAPFGTIQRGVVVGAAPELDLGTTSIAPATSAVRLVAPSEACYWCSGVACSCHRLAGERMELRSAGIHAVSAACGGWAWLSDRDYRGAGLAFNSGLSKDSFGTPSRGGCSGGESH